MFGPYSEYETLPKVANYFSDKSVFITGATGFVGTVLLEKLLRCCPTIKSIYILIRAKKAMKPEERKEEIFKKKIFKRLKDKNPKVLAKVFVINGEISLPDLGMLEKDLHMLIEEVSVVFHCAACIQLHKPLKHMLLSNVMSLTIILELCRRMRRLEALVYTSSVFCNYNYTNVTLKEDVYRLPFRSEKFLYALKNGDDKEIQELFTHCKPDWPNTYTFSKCLAENVIMDTASDLPVAIIRPSAITGTWKNPIPGYMEGNFILAAIFIGVGMGCSKILPGDPNSKFNFMPVDIVANSHVLAACHIGTNRSGSPMIVHCTSTENLNITNLEFLRTTAKVTRQFPIPQSFMEPKNFIVVPYWYLYYILIAFYHYLPAIVFDGVLKLFRKKPRVYSLFRFFDKSIASLDSILFYSNGFERNNFEKLDNLIHPEDRKEFDLDLRKANLLGLFSKMPDVSPFYDWKTDEKSLPERKNIMYWHSKITSCIQGSFIIVLIIIIYWIIVIIFK